MACTMLTIAETSAAVWYLTTRSTRYPGGQALVDIYVNTHISAPSEVIKIFGYDPRLAGNPKRRFPHKEIWEALLSMNIIKVDFRWMGTNDPSDLTISEDTADGLLADARKYPDLLTYHISIIGSWWQTWQPRTVDEWHRQYSPHARSEGSPFQHSPFYTPPD